MTPLAQQIEQGHSRIIRRSNIGAVDPDRHWSLPEQQERVNRAWLER
jgi:hypothetical protein